MNVKKQSYSIKQLVDAWEAAQLRRNPEYQRGEAWSPSQKQGLIDSAFRGYPLPPLFLQKIVSAGGLDGETSTKYEIVDGQQRLIACREYYADVYKLLKSQDRMLRLPTSLRSVPSPWGEKRYSELSSDLRATLDGTQIDVYVIEDITNSDQIRDLFIRLQSGTALTRQQIRDAWPGNVGPYIETLAGKLDKRPALELFRVIDRRGIRTEDEDQVDDYVGDRQTCAQLLRLFLARERDPSVAVSISAADLDGLYHEYTNFDVRGESAQRFEACLRQATDIFNLIAPLSISKTKRSRTKVRKIDAFATVMYLQDGLRNPNFRLDMKGKAELAKRIGDFEKSVQRGGKGTSGAVIREHYEKFRERVAQGIGVELDPKRNFDGDQKDLIRSRCGGNCAICSQPVEAADEEFDHFPLPHRDGGRTVVENGRLVCRRCHPRGRPPLESLEAFA